MSKLETWSSKEEAIQDLIEASDHIPESFVSQEATKSWIKSKKQFDDACNSFEPISVFEDEDDYGSDDDYIYADDSTEMHRVQTTLQKLATSKVEHTPEMFISSAMQNGSSYQTNYADCTNDSDVDLSFKPVDAADMSMNCDSPRESVKRQLSPVSSWRSKRKKPVCDFIKDSVLRTKYDFPCYDNDE